MPWGWAGCFPCSRAGAGAQHCCFRLFFPVVLQALLPWYQQPGVGACIPWGCIQTVLMQGAGLPYSRPRKSKSLCIFPLPGCCRAPSQAEGWGLPLDLLWCKPSWDGAALGALYGLELFTRGYRDPSLFLHANPPLLLPPSVLGPTEGALPPCSQSACGFFFFFFGTGTTLPIAPHHVAPQRLPQPLLLYASHLLTSRPRFREVHHL